MIDHLIRAADKPTMLGLLEPLGYATDTYFGVAVILNVGGPNDESIRVILAPEVLAAGFFVLVASEELDAALRDLPDNACRMIADRSANVLLYAAPDFDLATATLEPIPAGAEYELRAPA